MSGSTPTFKENMDAINAMVNQLIADRAHLSGVLQSIKNDLSGIERAELTKAEKNILAKISRVLP